jgi:hypothetical protein
MRSLVAPDNDAGSGTPRWAQKKVGVPRLASTDATTPEAVVPGSDATFTGVA